MSKKVNRQKLKKALTSREYLAIHYEWHYAYWYWDDYGSKKSGIYTHEYRKYRTWKHNRKTQWKQN